MRFLPIFLLVFLTPLYAQQLPNNSFEEWSDMNNPIDWSATATIQSTVAYEGNYSASLQVLGTTLGGTILPSLMLGGAGISERHNALDGFYRFVPNGGEWFFVSVTMLKKDRYIGVGSKQFTRTSPGTWKRFNVPITYSTEEIPDGVIILLTITDGMGSGIVGSYALVDYLYLGVATDVDNDFVKFEYNLAQNYPNPFNPNTTIKYSIPSQSYVTLKVFDVLGREVSLLANGEQPRGNYEVEFDPSNLASGIYFYRIQATPKGGLAGDYVKTKKMVLMK